MKEKLMQKTDIDIKGITLLSLEEFLESRKNIPLYDRLWWLRTPYSDNGLNTGRVDVHGDLDDNYVITHYVGVRPALILDRESSNLEIGDKLQIKGYAWTIISDRYALCDDIIETMPFRKDWKAPDANVYEASDIKKFLEDWWAA